jgi:WD40 repeat protein
MVELLHLFAENGLAVHAARLKRTYEVLDQLLGFVQSTSSVEHILFGPKELVEDVAFSSDGRYLASEHSIMSLIDKIMVWDVKSGKPLGPPLHLSNLTIPAYVTLGPEGTIVTVNPEGLLLRTWDPASGVMVHEEKIGLRLPGPIVALLAASTGRIAVIIGDGSVLWWDMKESGPIGGPLREHDASLTTAAFSKDGKLFATGDGDGNVVIWDVEKGTPVSRPDFSQNEKGQEIWVTGMAFSDDDKLLAWARKDATIAVWDIATKSLRRQLSAQQIQTAPIDGIAFQGNPEKLITLDGNGVMAEWSLESGPSNQATSVERLQFLEPNARHALSVDGIGAAGWGPEGNVVVWGKDIAASVLKRVSLAGQATSVRLSQDGERIAIYLKDGSVIIQDAAESGPPFPIRPEGGGIQSFAWFTGERLAVGTKDGHFSLWDAASRQRLPDLPPAPTPVVPIAFSVDGKRFLSWGIKPEQRRLWKIGVDKMEEIPTTKRFKDMLSGLSIMSAAFSPDGNLLAVGTFQGAMGIWDLRKDKWWAEPVNLFPNEGAFSTAFSPNGKWLASGHGGGFMLLWDVERGKQFGQGLKIFANGVSSLAFSTDGKRLIAVDKGQNLAIWDVDPESWMKRLCQLALPTLNRQEWKRIMGDQAYPPTCEEPQ